MISHSELWKQWQHKLSQWKLQTFAVTLIESSGVFHPVIAQFLLLSQPMFGQEAKKHLDAMIEIFEEPQECQAFMDYLGKESVQ